MPQITVWNPNMKKIIVFESEPFRQKFIEQTLKEESYEVYCLEKPLESDYMISDIDPDLILFSSLSYPNQWNEFLIKTKKVPIVFISESQIPGSVTLITPIDIQTLIEALSSSLNCSRE